MTEEVFAGIDLHGNNVMIGIVDERGRRLKHQKLGCDLKAIASFLEPWKPQLKSVAVESTYNWYWLVDGLRALDYPTKLANPAGIEQYSGIKHADDENDAPTISMNRTYPISRCRLLSESDIARVVYRVAGGEANYFATKLILLKEQLKNHALHADRFDAIPRTHR